MQVHSSTLVPKAQVLADPVLAELACVSEKNGLNSLAARLSGVRRWLQNDLAHLEEAIGDVCTTHGDSNHLANRAAAYLLKHPGKRIRPLCVIVAARIGGRKFDDELRHLAVAAELIHGATLLHDDVIDDGTERRGAATARVVFGNSASVLAGDHLLVKAMQLVQMADPKLLASMFATLDNMVAAESLQLARRGRFDANRDVYLNIVDGKTASLFAWALKAGGHAGGLKPEAITALSQCGHALGTAFQLVDDVLDFEHADSDLGKNTLADLKDGKVTWPLILAAESIPKVRDLLDEMAQVSLGGDAWVTEDAPLKMLTQAIRTSGALEATREFAFEKTKEAKTAIGMLPKNRATTALNAVIHTAFDRAR